MALNLTLRILGGEGANRLHQVLRTERGAHLRREGRHGHAARERRLRGVDQHAIRGDRRSAAADRGRVLAAAARARQRARAVGREGVHDRQLSADDRNAGRDRDAGAERAVLRPAGRAAPVVPRRGERGHARTTSSAWRATTCSPIGCRSCSSATRRRFVPQLRGLGFQHVRSRRDERSRPDGRGFQTDRRHACGPAAAAVVPPVGRTTGRPGTRLPGYVRSTRRRRSSRHATGRASRELLEQGDRRQGRPRAAARHQEHHRDHEGDGLGPNAQQGTVETVTYLEYPNHVRVESKTPRGDIVQVFDGSHAWVKDPAGTHDVPEQMVRDLEGESAARHDRGAARRRRRPDQRPAAARREGRERRAALRDRVLGAGPRSDDSVRRSRDESRREADLRRGRTGHAARRGALQRLPPGRRRPDRVRHDRPRPRRAGARAPRHDASRSTRPSAQRCSNVRPLEPARSSQNLLSCGEPSGDLYAGALTRELRIARAGHRGRRAWRTGVSPRRRPAARRLSRARRHRLHRGRRARCRARAAKRRLVAAARADRPDALVVIDYFGFNVRLARASSSSASRSSTTSARRSGPGVPAG